MPPDGPGTGARLPAAGEIYFEFQQIGNAVKVTAIDATSGLEVVVMGPHNTAQADLEQLAMRKLRRRQSKR